MMTWLMCPGVFHFIAEGLGIVLAGRHSLGFVLVNMTGWKWQWGGWPGHLRLAADDLCASGCAVRFVVSGCFFHLA